MVVMLRGSETKKEMDDATVKTPEARSPKLARSAAMIESGTRGCEKAVRWVVVVDERFGRCCPWGGTVAAGRAPVAWLTNARTNAKTAGVGVAARRSGVAMTVNGTMCGTVATARVPAALLTCVRTVEECVAARLNGATSPAEGSESAALLTYVRTVAECVAARLSGATSPAEGSGSAAATAVTLKRGGVAASPNVQCRRWGGVSPAGCRMRRGGETV